MLPRAPAILLFLFLPLAFPWPADADEVRLLDTAREAAEERIRLILEAREEINAEYFIIGDDPFSLTGLALLRDAARRGLDVRLLVDAQWNKMPRPVEAHLVEEGVEIRLYHPFRLRKPRWITRRLHDKLLLVDAEEMVAGGRNIESPYFDLGQQLDRRNYIDMDIVVRGKSAGEARAYFMELWDSDQVGRSKASASPDKLGEAEAALDGRKRWLDERIGAIQQVGNNLPALADVGAVEFLHDPVGRKGLDPGVGQALLALLDGAESSVLLESPYLVPTRAFKKGLARAQTRGVRVRILTNSLATTDNLLPQAGYAGQKKGLVRGGVELWEYSGPESLHSKVGVIDDHIVIVGSFNLDPRSERLNTELAIVVRDSHLAAEMQSEMERHLERAVRIDRKGRPEGAKRRYPGVSRWKVFKLSLLRPIAWLIKRQL